MNKFINLYSKERAMSICGIPISKYVILIEDLKKRKTSEHLAPPVNRPTEIKAAKQLQKYIFAATGIVLAITYDTVKASHPYTITVGKACKEIAVDYDKLGDEGYLIKTYNNNLAITGGIRGVLYGVYSFLEEYLGFRFLDENVEKMKGEDILIGEIDQTFIPKFEYREVMFWNAWDSEFSIKQKINGNFVRKLGEEEGFGVGYVGSFNGLVHTFDHLLPPKDYFDAHPEYYALHNGKRTPTQPCLTNPNVQDIIIKNVKQWLKDDPNPSIISVSINDNSGYCKCDDCARVDEIEKSHMGTVLRLVNAVADEIKEEYPQVVVDTIAYGYTRDVPAITLPRENVAIRLCTSGCRSHPLEQCGANVVSWDEMVDYNVGFDKDIAGKWSAVCNKLYIWDYVVNYFKQNTIYPNFYTFLPNVRFFLKHNAKGVYSEGATDSGEFFEMRVYLIAKLLWKPTMSKEEFYGHMDDFLQCFYGEGWLFIKQFIELAEKQTKDVHFGCSSPIKYVIPCETVQQNGKTIFDLSFINQSYELFEKAENVAKNISEKNRILKAKIQLDYYNLYMTMEERYNQGTKFEQEELTRLNKDLFERMQRFGIKRLVGNFELPKINDFSKSPKHWENN